VTTQVGELSLAASWARDNMRARCLRVRIRGPTRSRGAAAIDREREAISQSKRSAKREMSASVVIPMYNMF
jgi:hypothetical protein